MEFSMTSPDVWRLFGWLENNCAGHTPWNFHIWRPKGQGWSAVLQWGDGRAIDLSGGQGQIPYKEGHVLLEDSGRSRLVTWPPWLQTLSLPFWSQLSLNQHNLHASLIQAYCISKFYKKVKRKCAGNQEEQWLYGAQVRIFYLIVKVGYYPLLSLACASV